jgi:hypothetical protein
MSESPPRCGAQTKRGTPCSRPRIRGHETCLAHAPADVRRSRGFTPEAGRLGGRPRNPRVVEVIKDRIEAQVDTVLAPLVEALSATTPTGHPDHPVRLRAAAELLDRAYGRPRQATEVSGPEGAPLLTLADLVVRYAQEDDSRGNVNGLYS